MLKLYSVKIAYSPILPENTLMAPPNVQESGRLKSGQQIKICAGNRGVTVCLAGAAKHDNGDTLYLAENVRDALLLPAQAILNLAMEPDSPDWRLGPVIGIFANRSEKVNKPFGEQTSFLRSLSCKAGKLRCFCFAFSPEDIDWENEVIRGSVPPDNGSAEWQTMLLPFPDVIYDRGLFPRGEKRKTATEARRILRNYPGVTMFNPAFFGKWKTHRLLARHETLNVHLPDTRLYTAMADVYELLNRHGVVYLKPSGGSSGRGILRLTTTPAGYVVNFRHSRQVKTLKLPDRFQLEGRLTALMNGYRYIIQQGLNLAVIDGCPFDVRVLMQKNVHGLWRRTGMALRVAAPNHFISNIHAGGHAAKLSDILPGIFPNPAIRGKIIQDIRRICSLIACWVSGEGNPLFGEIAIDLGVDVKGKVWIIELNAIPGRSVFRRIGAQETLAKAISRPMEYAYFLSGFEPRNYK